ncbi:hypothetical protein [Nonomuraea jabiensis]|uniref:hypothetical protein n=1 Tax=Nonomuraea jabiensis TaxID=882448 RepID=UPI003D71C78C
MARGPGGDRFHAEWLAVALRALPAGRAAHRASTVGIEGDRRLLQVRATRSGMEVTLHDGSDPDAVVRADAPAILGPASGWALDDTHGLADI